MLDASLRNWLMSFDKKRALMWFKKKALGSSFTRYFCRLHIGRVAVFLSNLLIALAIGRLMHENICIDGKSDAGIGLPGIAQDGDDLTRVEGLRYNPQQ